MRDKKLMVGRSVVSLAIIGLAAIGWLINDHSVAIMSFLSGIPREQIADLGNVCNGFHGCLLLKQGLLKQGLGICDW